MLSDIIIQKIQKEGPLSFHDFMEIALYHPELGYYSSNQNKIGQGGDFYTSSCLTPAFGAMIGKQLEEMWLLLDKKAFTIVEYGAGTGYLCHDILDYLKHNLQLYDQLHYCIIEKSPSMCKMQKTHLKEKVSWHNSIHEIPGITGCIISNELVDNFSVHQVVMEDELMEVFVNYNNGYTEILKPAKQPLKDYFKELNVDLGKGYRTEINLEAIDWIKEIAINLKKGYVITIDYGYTSNDLYKRRQGTLVCYHQHQVNTNPYQSIGEQDITSHVNFTALCHWGRKSGLKCCGLTDQQHFLINLGFTNYLERTLAQQDQDIVSLAKQAAFITHTLLVDIGSKFKVLILCKGSCKHHLQSLSSNLSVSS